MIDTFILTFDEHGNVGDHVRKSEIIAYRRIYRDVTDHHGTKRTLHRATLRSGECVWIDSNHDLDGKVTIPNTTGISALIDWRCDWRKNPETCPAPYKHVPIVGWRIGYEDFSTPPQPVIPEGWGESQIWLLYPNGTVSRDDGNNLDEFASIQEWINAE